RKSSICASEVIPLHSQFTSRLRNTAQPTLPPGEYGKGEADKTQDQTEQRARIEEAGLARDSKRFTVGTAANFRSSKRSVFHFLRFGFAEVDSSGVETLLRRSGNYQIRHNALFQKTR